ncbi:MAG: FkbM family methyltransferase [Pseudomonadota bacterium]
MTHAQKLWLNVRLILIDLLFQSRIPFRGYRIFVPKTVVKTKIRRLVLDDQRYERPETDLVSKYISANVSVIELGGSLGAVSSFIARNMSPGQTHIVLEAVPALAQLCERNASYDGQRHVTRVINKALSYAPGATVRFLADGNAHIGRLALADEPSIEVQSTTLADLRKGLDADTDFAVVCDVEGAEYEIIDKDADMLKRATVAIIEFHDRDSDGNPVDIDAYLATLPEKGFRVLERIEDVAAIQNAT